MSWRRKGRREGEMTTDYNRSEKMKRKMGSCLYIDTDSNGGEIPSIRPRTRPCLVRHKYILHASIELKEKKKKKKKRETLIGGSVPEEVETELERKEEKKDPDTCTTGAGDAFVYLDDVAGLVG